MTRVQLEHIIRAAGAIANTEDLVIIGSQAVLGEFPNAPVELLVSREADIFPRDDPARGELIDGSIGEGSPFDREFGYFAHGVDENTARLPEGWRGRLILVSGENTRFVRGWCLEIHALAIAKYVGAREKDLEFTRVVARHSMVSRPVLEQRLDATSVDPEVRSLVRKRIDRDFASLQS